MYKMCRLSTSENNVDVSITHQRMRTNFEFWFLHKIFVQFVIGFGWLPFVCAHMHFYVLCGFQLLCYCYCCSPVSPVRYVRCIFCLLFYSLFIIIVFLAQLNLIVVCVVTQKINIYTLTTCIVQVRAEEKERTTWTNTHKVTSGKKGIPFKRLNNKKLIFFSSLFTNFFYKTRRKEFCKQSLLINQIKYYQE